MVALSFPQEPAQVPVPMPPLPFSGESWSPIPALQSGRVLLWKGWVTWTCLIPSPLAKALATVFPSTRKNLTSNSPSQP